jgi:hypothetical protein
MKRFFLIYVAVILTAASSCYASMASMYNYDISQFRSTYDGGNKVTVYAPWGGGVLYLLRGRTIEAMYSVMSIGSVWDPARVAQIMTQALDRPGQSWVHTGSLEWATNDGRIYTKVFWYNGAHVLRIAYKGHLDRYGLLNYYNNRPKARAKAKVQRRELLPPVEES